MHITDITTLLSFSTFLPEAEPLMKHRTPDDETLVEFNGNLEVLEDPVPAKETTANVKVLLDTQVDSAESRIFFLHIDANLQI